MASGGAGARRGGPPPQGKAWVSARVRAACPAGWSTRRPSASRYRSPQQGVAEVSPPDEQPEGVVGDVRGRREVDHRTPISKLPPRRCRRTPPPRLRRGRPGSPSRAAGTVRAGWRSPPSCRSPRSGRRAGGGVRPGDARADVDRPDHLGQPGAGGMPAATVGRHRHRRAARQRRGRGPVHLRLAADHLALPTRP